MAYNATTQIFQYMDQVSQEFVSSNLAIIINTVTPVVALALTMSLMIQGVYTMMNGDGEPLTDLVQKFFRYAVICSIASAGGLYQQQLANVALKTPDEFASVLIIDGASGSNQQDAMASTIDKALEDGIKTAQQAFDAADIWSGAGLASLFLAAGVLISTIMICGIGAALILMAKFLLAIAVCFGPVFIFCLLFEALQDLFTKWIGSIINFGLITILLAAVFGLLMKFYSKAIAAAASATGDSPILVPIVTCGLLTVVSWFVLKQIPDLASSWGSGVAAAFKRGMSRKAGGGGGGGGGAGNAGGGGSPGGKAVDPSAGGGAGGGAAGAAGGAAGAAGAAASAATSGMRGMARGSRGG